MNMPALLRVLVVEDSDNDTHLMLNELRRGGYDVEHERVDTRAAMRDALSLRTWDIILCDYTLPQFSAMSALTTLQESGPDIPFIVISGTVGEETAVAILKAGAHDFILKGRMARLVPAIERAIQDAHTRRLHLAAEEERKKLIEKLESINAEIERFTYAAFHDLRAPLVTIKGFLGFLEKDLAARNDEKVREDLQRIARSANQMDKLLADLLELFRIGRVGKPPEEVDLRKLVQETLQKLDRLIRSKNVSVTVSADFAPVYGDRIRLREVMENLIENAVKYMGEQAHPLVEIGARRENGQQIVFVRDNGQGIEPRYHNRIFNLFETLDPNMQGAGIGLALTRRIIEVHRGKIWVESEGQGKGSTFYFTIPDRRNSSSVALAGG
jgi:signal transduction histidine kinase